MRIKVGTKTLWVNYHHLYCFMTIARETSLVSASKALGIGQSALSIQMKQFEAHLGFNLFERAHRKLSLTENGRIVFSYAKEIFRLGNEMVETLHDRPTANRIHLQIGALDTIPKHLTKNLVKSALQFRPCSVGVIEGGPTQLLRELLSHQLDLMVTNYLPVANPGQIYAKKIARLPLWIVSSKKYRGLKKGFPKSLDGAPFIVPTGDNRVRHDFEDFCRQNDVRPDIVAETQDVMIQKLLAVDGVGLTVVPRYAVRDYLLRKELFLVDRLGVAYEELFLVAATRKIDNPVAAHLIKKFEITE